MGAASLARSDDKSSVTAPVKVALVFQGGHDTDPRDHGRPVALVAAALGVPPQVFREAFSHVHPAPAGEQPTQDEVHENKRQLLSRLAPYGVTNERLDEVSNYYRYRRESGELWRHADAVGYAMVAGCKIVSITITNPGAGYSSAPKVSLQTGLTVYPMALVFYGTDLARNGSISKIVTSAIGDDSHTMVVPTTEGGEIQQGTVDTPSDDQEVPTPAPAH